MALKYKALIRFYSIKPMPTRSRANFLLAFWKLNHKASSNKWLSAILDEVIERDKAFGPLLKKIKICLE